jgi:hypothetical protein
MTTKAAFSPEEWDVVIEGPTSAGMMVLTASRGGTFRETYAMPKAYTDARSHHGQSELLDEIVSSRPKTDHTRTHSSEELFTHGLELIRDAVALVAANATPAELEDYRGFLLTVANEVAVAHREHGQDVNPAEAAVVEQLTEVLHGAGS